MSMLTLMRSPTSMPEPRDSRLQFTPTPAAIVTAVPTRVIDENRLSTWASSVMSMTAAEATPPMASALAASRASDPAPSRTISVSPAATPSAKVSRSSTMKCWRIGTARSTPSTPAVDSHANDCSGVSTMENAAPGRAASMSKAASRTHMNAVCAAAVPAVWTMLFSQRL